MSMSLQDFILDKQVQPPNKRLIIRNTTVNGAHDVLPYQTEIYIYNSGTVTETLTLPFVAEAKGKTYTIRAMDFGGGVTIQNRDDGLEWSDLNVDADGEYVCLYCDGRQWHVLATDIA